MPSRKPDSGRREKRQLVRWDGKCPYLACFPIASPTLTTAVDHDIMLLLTIQQVCNAQGIKLPWKEIAEVMGPKFSEGAIIQHLAKLRLRRLNEGKKVPPPLRRSVVGSTGGRGQVISSERTNKDSKRKPGSRNKKRRGSSDESENEDEMSSAESSDVDDPSYSQRSSKKDRAKKRFKLSSGNKDRTSSANRDKRGVGASPFASNDEDSYDGPNIFDLFTLILKLVMILMNPTPSKMNMRIKTSKAPSSLQIFPKSCVCRFLPSPSIASSEPEQLRSTRSRLRHSSALLPAGHLICLPLMSSSNQPWPRHTLL